MKIEIVNWEKYNERKNRVNYSWFRFQADFFNDQVMYDLSCNQKLLFVFLLCMRNKSEDPKFEISLAYVSHWLNSDKDTISNDLNYLQNKGVIKRFDAGAKPHNVSLQTDVTNKHTNTIVQSKIKPKMSDFELIYKNYPKKVGKKKGLIRCKAQIKTEKEFESLRQAVDNYVAVCKREKKQPQFIMQFDTFMNRWNDYLDKDIGECQDYSNEVDPKTKEWINE